MKLKYSVPDSDFYTALPAFLHFDEVVEDRHYRKVPDDWVVFVADIQGSTEAIEAGRYKDVNTLGAACIVAAQNAMDKQEFPYVFGGDGATMIVAPRHASRVAAALDGMRRLSVLMFDMTLRVGLVPVKVIRAAGCEVEIAKHELCAGKSIALFRGGGLSKADSLVKGEYEKYAVKEDLSNKTDLSGLSCRWNPIPSEKGKILTMLISSSAKNSQEVYQEVLNRLSKIMGGNMRGANPVHVSNMDYKSICENLRSEWRYHTNHLSWEFISRALGIVYSVLVFRWNVPPLFFDAKHYAGAMADHSDFRKFDDVLRFVLDCSLEQIETIKKCLEGLRAEAGICYGTHESDTALMTCFVYDASDGGHIHFIDGGDGGYAMAAKPFKAQLKK